MEIKKQSTRPVPVCVDEWNDEVKAFLKLDGLDVFTFQQRANAYWTSDDPATKFDAAFEAAVVGLKDADGKPILTLDDRETIRAASYVPLVRVLTVYANEIGRQPEPPETLKKS